MTPETKKRLPDVIYIIDPYDENGNLVTNTEDVCWCQDAVGDENVAYVSRAAIAAALAALRKKIKHEYLTMDDALEGLDITIAKLGIKVTQ